MTLKKRKIPVRMPSLFADEERGAGFFSSYCYPSPSLFFPFSSLVLGLGFLFWVWRIGVSFPSPFFLRHGILVLSCLVHKGKKGPALTAILSVYLPCVCFELAKKPKETPTCRREASALTVECSPSKASN